MLKETKSNYGEEHRQKQGWGMESLAAYMIVLDPKKDLSSGRSLTQVLLSHCIAGGYRAWEHS
jgi:hypothetical protein